MSRRRAVVSLICAIVVALSTIWLLGLFQEAPPRTDEGQASWEVAPRYGAPTGRYRFPKLATPPVNRRPALPAEMLGWRSLRLPDPAWRSSRVEASVVINPSHVTITGTVLNHHAGLAYDAVRPANDAFPWEGVEVLEANWSAAGGEPVARYYDGRRHPGPRHVLLIRRDPAYYVGPRGDDPEVAEYRAAALRIAYDAITDAYCVLHRLELGAIAEAECRRHAIAARP